MHSSDLTPATASHATPRHTHTDTSAHAHTRTPSSHARAPVAVDASVAATAATMAASGSTSPVTFASLNLAPPIARALVDEGYTVPTPIQARAIPPAAEGRDILGCAQTGTGKTAAFALPILHRLVSTPNDKSHRGPILPRVLVLSPTRELAGQIGDSFAAYGRHTGLTHTTIYGGVSQHHQVRALQRGVDILIATPGRLMDLMQQRVVDLTRVSIFVLDEADRMLDMGFIQPIRRIAASLPKTRQTMLFSATMPRDIQALAESLLREPVRVAVTPVASAAPLIEQSVYMIARNRKQALLEHLINDGKIAKALVFTRTKRGADVVTRRLNEGGITSIAIHGNKAQNQRQRALDGFKVGRSRILVATDVAARGIDIDNISHVVNYDVPNEAEAYVHRIGRTGRAGATGLAITLCDEEERGLLRDIERLTGKKITIAEPVTGLVSREHTYVPSEGREHRERPRSDRGSYSSSSSSRAPAPAGKRHPSGHGHGPARHPLSSGPRTARATGDSTQSARPAARASSSHASGGGGGRPSRAGGPGAAARPGMNHFRGKPRRGGSR